MQPTQPAYAACRATTSIVPSAHPQRYRTRITARWWRRRLQEHEYEKAIETLKSFEKKNEKLLALAATNLSFL